MSPLMFQEPLLPLQATPIAYQRALCADNTVAGDKDGQAIGSVGPGDGPDGFLVSQEA